MIVAQQHCSSIVAWIAMEHPSAVSVRWHTNVGIGKVGLELGRQASLAIPDALELQGHCRWVNGEGINVPAILKSQRLPAPVLRLVEQVVEGVAADFGVLVVRRELHLLKAHGHASSTLHVRTECHAVGMEERECTRHANCRHSTEHTHTHMAAAHPRLIGVADTLHRLLCDVHAWEESGQLCPQSAMRDVKGCKQVCKLVVALGGVLRVPIEAFLAIIQPAVEQNLAHAREGGAVPLHLPADLMRRLTVDGAMADELLGPFLHALAQALHAVLINGVPGRVHPPPDAIYVGNQLTERVGGLLVSWPGWAGVEAHVEMLPCCEGRGAIRNKDCLLRQREAGVAHDSKQLRRILILGINALLLSVTAPLGWLICWGIHGLSFCTNGKR